MSKRQERREQLRRKQKRNRFLTIAAVTTGAVLISLFLILPGLRLADPGNITQITPKPSDLPVQGTSMGNPDAPVKIDVWEDFQCSGCYSYSKNLEPRILQEYVATGKAYYTFHFYPFIDGGQGESQDAANASLCAAAQGRFWEYHDIVFANWLGENVGSFTRQRLTEFARNIGLDMASFDQCLQENTYAAQIWEDMEAGADLGVPPTPGIFVNDRLVTSSAGKNYIPSFDDIARAIEAGLNGE